MNFGAIKKLIQTNSLLKNALNLMLSAGLTAIFGFVFWIVVARSFDSATVGLATTLLSVSGLISLLGLLGFDTIFVRFLAKAKNRSEQLNTGLLISALASAVLSLGFCLFIPIFAPKLEFVNESIWSILIFVVVTVLSTWNTLTNAALIAFRRTSFVVVINIIFGVIKLCLPFVLHGSGPMVIFAFFGIAQIVNVVLSVVALCKYFGYVPSLRIHMSVLSEIKKFGSAVYVAHLVNLLPDSIMPIIVINRLGATAGAYFYVAFSIANLLYTIAYATNQALLAESANDEDKFTQHAKHGLRINLVLITSALIVTVAASPLVLSLFGSDYKTGATELLRVLCLAAPPIMLYSFITFLFRHTKNLKAIITIAIVNAVFILGLAPVFTERYGLVGVGWAYVIGNVISVLVGLWLLRMERRKRMHTQTPENIVISHFYSTDNCGDAALVSVLTKDAKKAYPEAKVTILATDTLGKIRTFEDTPLQSSFMFYAMHRYKNKIATLLYATYVMFATTVWVIWYRLTGLSLPIQKHFKNLCRLYSTADMVLLVGGGYLRGQGNGIGSFLYCALMVHPLLLSKIMGTPSYLYSQSVGPFSSRFEAWWVSRVLKHCSKAIFLREDISYDLLKAQGVKQIFRAVDSGFAFTSSRAVKTTLRDRFKIPANKLIVGMTAKKYLRGDDQKAYEKALSDTVRHIVTNHNAAVVFIPQVTARYHEDDDRNIHANIRSYLKGVPDVHDITTKMDVSEVRKVYEELDLMIGTRFHSVIFSLSSFVPAIAIEYEHKTSGIMKDLELSQWTVKIENIDPAELGALFDALVGDRTAYRKHLKRVLPAYIQKAHDPMARIKELYEKRH